MSAVLDLADPFAAFLGAGRGVPEEPIRRHPAGGVYMSRFAGALALPLESHTPRYIETTLANVSAALGVKVVAMWVLDDETGGEPEFHCDLFIVREDGVYTVTEPVHDLLCNRYTKEDLVLGEPGWREWRPDEVIALGTAQHLYVTRYSVQHAGIPFDAPDW